MVTASFLILSQIMTAPASVAPPREVLSFGTVLRRAARQNPDLRRARLDLEGAIQGIREARGAYDPNLSAGVSYSGSTATPVPGQFFQPLRTDIFGYSVSATQRLPTGGTIGLKLETGLNRQKTRISFDPTAPPQDRVIPTWESKLVLTVSHPLLKGIGTDVGYAAMRQARLGRDASRWALLGRARAVVRDLLKAYLDVVEARQSAAVRRSALSQAKRELERAQRLIDTGRVAEAELVERRLQVAQRRREVLEVRTLWLTRSLELLRMMGSVKSEKAVLIDAHLAGLPLRENLPTPADARRRSLEASADLKAARGQLKIALISERVARRNKLPSLDLSGSFGPAGQSDRIGKSYENMFRFRGLSWSVGLTFTYLIGNRTAKAAARKASLEVRKQEVTIDDLRRTLATSAVRSVALLRQQWQLIKVSGMEVRLAALRLEHEKRKFKVGRSSTFTLYQMENALIQARFKVVAARVAYLKSRADLAALTGELLPGARVRVSRSGVKVSGSR